MRAEKADELDTKYVYEINSRWSVDGASRSNIARYATTPAVQMRSPTHAATPSLFARPRTSKPARRSPTITAPITSRRSSSRWLPVRQVHRQAQGGARREAGQGCAREEARGASGEKLKEAARAAAKRKEGAPKAKTAKADAAKVKVTKAKTVPRRGQRCQNGITTGRCRARIAAARPEPRSASVRPACLQQADHASTAEITRYLPALAVESSWRSSVEPQPAASGEQHVFQHHRSTFRCASQTPPANRKMQKPGQKAYGRAFAR